MFFKIKREDKQKQAKIGRIEVKAFERGSESKARGESAGQRSLTVSTGTGGLPFDERSRRFLVEPTTTNQRTSGPLTEQVAEREGRES